jgi:hypothetical protein
MAWNGRLNRRSWHCRSPWSHWSRRRRRHVERNRRLMERIQTALPRLLGFGGGRGYVLDFIILVGRKVLIG